MKQRCHARRHVVHMLLVPALFAIAGGCQSSSFYRDAGTPGSAYVPGEPNYDFRAHVVWGEGGSQIALHMAVPPAALVFVQRGASFDASFEYVARLFDDRDRLLDEHLTSRTISSVEFDSTTSFQPYHDVIRLRVDPGRYVVRVSLVDRSSGREAVRTASLTIRGTDRAFLSEPLLATDDDTTAQRPILTPFLPANATNIRMTVQYREPDSGGRLLSMQLTRVQRDTSLANPPYWITPRYGTLAHFGVDLSSTDTVWSAVREITVSDDGSWHAFELPPLMHGLYRLSVEVEDGRGELQYENRYLLVTDPNFPRVETLDQLVDALGYIAYEREVARIREARHPLERRSRFDAFWGSLVPQRAVASNLVQTYYARIEEANLLFSGFKEGWKTDRGMIYVIMGAPLYIDAYAESEVWRYTYNDDALHTFVFDRVRVPHSEGLFENYVLRRRPYYEHVWLQVLDRWRSGVVL